MMTQDFVFHVGIALVLVFGILTCTGFDIVEAFDWDNLWKPTTYEKWNCCPGFNPNINFKPIPSQETINSKEIIQNIEVNQVCERVQICLVSLHDLNSQVNYSDR